MTLHTAMSITVHDMAAEAASGSPSFSVMRKRERTPATEARSISETACGDRFSSLLCGFDISKKATMSGGAMKKISLVSAGIMQMMPAAAICLIRSVNSYLSGCTGVNTFFSRKPHFSSIICARRISEVITTTEPI